MKFSDETYEVLKWATLVFLPGLGTLYSEMAKLWGWPFIEQIPGTLQTLAFFIGSLIGVSTIAYKRGLEK